MSMGLGGARHLRQHSADGGRVFLGWEQHGQVEKAAGQVPKSRALLVLFRGQKRLDVNWTPKAPPAITAPH